MKKSIVALLAVGSLLGGCVAFEPYEPIRYGQAYTNGDHDNGYARNRSTYRDRDGDGVPNRWDARPDNPRRY